VRCDDKLLCSPFSFFSYHFFVKIPKKEASLPFSIFLRFAKKKFQDYFFQLWKFKLPARHGKKRAAKKKCYLAPTPPTFCYQPPSTTPSNQKSTHTHHQSSSLFLKTFYIFLPSHDVGLREKQIYDECTRKHFFISF